jgi:hypothetical protein
MAVADQVITDRYALYLGDCLDVMPTLPDGSIHLSVYSPPFAGLYHYSSSPRDLSNCRDYDEFFAHYEYVVRALHRLTMPGRMTAVHCMDVPSGNTGLDYLTDFPGDIIRLHRDCGFNYVARYHVWKEPLAVRNRTMTKALAHKSSVRSRPSFSPTRGGRGIRSRTATRIGSGDSTRPRSGTTSASTASCRTVKRATRRTRSTSTPCSLTLSTVASSYGATPARRFSPRSWGLAPRSTAPLWRVGGASESS